MEFGATKSWSNRNGFTLVEMLVVITIISILVAIAVPAISATRDSARMATCKHNQHQLWVGLSTHADRTGEFCSGAFSWKYDGAVTEVGWVADLVKQGILPGKLLCPSNPAQLSETYDELLNLSATSDFSCATSLSDAHGSNALGTAARTDPGGNAVSNPCRELLLNDGSGLMAAGDARRVVVEEKIYDPGYNTNYTASWFLVRSQPNVDGSGNLKGTGGCAPQGLEHRYSTLGPLGRGLADSSGVSQSIIPFLGCGGPARSPAGGATLGANRFVSDKIGPHKPGEMYAAAFTQGPVNSTTLVAPAFAAGTAYAGAAGWWNGWNATVQDYRQFAPVHRGHANIVFADGSVRNFEDTSEDSLLNSGFAPPTTPVSAGFIDATVELPKHDVYSRWRLKTE